jgi:hypothetical protein
VGKSARIAVAFAAAILLVLVLAQLLLPGIAANRISARLSRYGSVESVKVKAFPALKLLWHNADSVTVKATSLKLTPAQTATLLWEGRGLNEIDMTASSVLEGPLQLHEVSVRKRATRLTGRARASEAEVRSALPQGLGLQLLASEGGKVKVRASGGLFGAGGSVDAVVAPSEGKLVVRPVGFPLSGLALTLFSEPHVYVVGVGATAQRGPEGTAGYQLALAATLR